MEIGDGRWKERLEIRVIVDRVADKNKEKNRLERIKKEKEEEREEKDNE